MDDIWIAEGLHHWRVNPIPFGALTLLTRDSVFTTRTTTPQPPVLHYRGELGGSSAAVDTATALVGIDSPPLAFGSFGAPARRGRRSSHLVRVDARLAVQLTVKHVPGVADPLDQNAPWYLLIELSSPNPRQDLGTLLTAILEDAARRHIVDAMFATSMTPSQAMWKLRESVPEAQRRHGASLKHDVSVPVSALRAHRGRCGAGAPPRA